MEQALSVRIPKEGLKEIEQISRYERATKSAVLREILDLGIREKKTEIGIEKFLRGEATAWKAARIAGIPLTEFLDILKERGVEFHYTEKELVEEFADIE